MTRLIFTQFSGNFGTGRKRVLGYFQNKNNCEWEEGGG